MNEKSHPELEVVELGDAKELTMGIHSPAFAEEDPQVQGKTF